MALLRIPELQATDIQVATTGVQELDELVALTDNPIPVGIETRGGDEFLASNAGIGGLPSAPGDNDDLKAELLLLARPTSPNNHLTNLIKQDQQFCDRQKVDNFILSKNQAKTKYQK